MKINTYKNSVTLLENILIFISLLLLWMPNSYSYILSPTVYTLHRFLQYGVAFVFMFIVLISSKHNQIFILNVTFSLVLIISTLIHNGNLNKCLNYVAPMLGTVAMIVYFFGSGNKNNILRIMKTILIIYCIVNIITFFAFPHGMYYNAFTSVFAIEKRNTFLGNRNAYKFYGLLLIFISYCEAHSDKNYEKIKNKNKMLVPIFISLFMEFLGGSLTGILVIGFITLYYYLGDKMLKIKNINPKIMFVISVIIFLFLMVFVSAGKYVEILSYLFNGNVTFSNRVRIWNNSIEVIKNYPLLGIGTQSSEHIFKMIYNVHSHNQFIEITLRSGIIGLLIYVLIIWHSFSQMNNYRRYSMIPFLSMCLFAAIVINMMEVETYSYCIISFFTAVICSWDFPEEFMNGSAKK